MFEFVEIKDHPNFIINKAGTVRNTKTGNVLMGSIGNSGYLSVRITDNCGITKTWGLHRLLAWVFIANFDDIENMEVNHDDGNKLNNAVDNLEILTRRENVEHAGREGLTEKCKPILLRDISTGVTKRYPSVIAYARETSISKDIISSRCHRGEKFHYNGFQFKFGWDAFDETITPVEHTGRDIPILVRDVFTGIVTEYNNSFLAAVGLSVSIASISKYIRDRNHPVLKGFVQLKPKESLDPWVDHIDPIRNYETTNMVRCIYTWDKNGVRTLHYSAREAARFLNIAANALDYRLKSKNSTCFKDGTRCAYY